MYTSTMYLQVHYACPASCRECDAGDDASEQRRLHDPEGDGGRGVRGLASAEGRHGGHVPAGAASRPRSLPRPAPVPARPLRRRHFLEGRPRAPDASGARLRRALSRTEARHAADPLDRTDSPHALPVRARVERRAHRLRP